MSDINHESFFVGGEYAGPTEARVMRGQMFVEMLTPKHVTHPWPLVMIHGAGQTAMNWMATPDGRQGWAPWFAERGWKVCMIDQPARGRSAWQPGLDGELKTFSVSAIQDRFTATAHARLWPRARLHTQWPGSGKAGDPVFDQFYASQVPFLSNPESEALMRAAGGALLDRIGPAIVMIIPRPDSLAGTSLTRVRDWLKRSWRWSRPDRLTKMRCFKVAPIAPLA